MASGNTESNIFSEVGLLIFLLKNSMPPLVSLWAPEAWFPVVWGTLITCRPSASSLPWFRRKRLGHRSPSCWVLEAHGPF